MRILKDTVIVCFTTKKNKYNLSSSSKKIPTSKMGDELRPLCKIT